MKKMMITARFGKQQGALSFPVPDGMEEHLRGCYAALEEALGDGVDPDPDKAFILKRMGSGVRFSVGVYDLSIDL